MVDGSDDVVAGSGDGFHSFGSEDKPNISKELLTEHLGNCNDDDAVLLRDGENRQLQSRSLWNHVQDCRDQYGVC